MKKNTINLQEYITSKFEKDELEESTARLIYHKYKKQINIDYPSFKTQYKWELMSQGWVGLIPVDKETTISMNPKIRIENLFTMWEYAYKLKSFHILDGMIKSNTVGDFYNQLAYLLAKGVSDRNRKGLYKSYEEKQEKLPYITGRMLIEDAIKRPWDVYRECQYHEISLDNIHNQILLWTLYILLKSGNLNDRVLPVVKKAYKALIISVNLIRLDCGDCLGQDYNSLNQDYKLLHSVCRFFLENRGPSYQHGKFTMIPFMVNMARLFELFIAQWLKMNLPPDLSIRSQETFLVGGDAKIRFNIDLVIYDSLTGNVKCVLDTKYKDPKNIQKNDINQIVTYAVTKKCNKGILLYPIHIEPYGHYPIQDIDVYTIGFNIEEDIEEGGKEFLNALMSVL